jgi:hypothetical protein
VWSISIDFNAEAIGIPEVDGFAHSVIRRSKLQTKTQQMANDTAQRGSVRQEDGEVIKAEQTAPWHRACAAMLVQLSDDRVCALRGQDAATAGSDGLKSEHATVESHGAIQVTDLQPNSSNVRILRQSIPRRSNTILANGGRAAHRV